MLAFVHTRNKISPAYSEWGNSFTREEDLLRRRKDKPMTIYTFLFANTELSSLMISSQDQFACVKKVAKYL